METTIKDKLSNLTATMMLEDVGGDEDRYQEWLNIRFAINMLCGSLEGVVSHEKWISTITEINQIRKRVENLKVVKWLWLKIKEDLDNCVKMITEHERVKSIPDVSNMLHELKMIGSCE
jgi:hypothetical protein